MNNNYKNQTREIITQINYGYLDEYNDFVSSGSLDNFKDLTIEYDCDTLPIGCCLVGTAHFNCSNNAGINLNIKKGTILKINYYMSDGTGTAIPGSNSDNYYFYIETAKTSSDNKTVEVTAYDLVGKILTANNDSEQRFSGTFTNAYDAINSYYNGLINTNSYTQLNNITLTEDECTKLKEYTVRDALGYIVGKQGYFLKASTNAVRVEAALIGWDNAWYNQDGRESWYIDGERQALRLDKINVGIDGDSDYADYEPSVDDPTKDEISSPIFITNPLGGSADDMATILYGCIPAIILTSDNTYLFNAGAYETGQVKMRGDPDLSIGKSFVFDDAWGKTHRVIICGLSIDLSGGGLAMEIHSKAPRDSFDLQKQDTGGGSGGGVTQEEMEQYVSENTVSEETMEEYVNENAVSERAMREYVSENATYTRSWAQRYVDNNTIPKSELNNLQKRVKTINSNLIAGTHSDDFNSIVTNRYDDDKAYKYLYCLASSPSQSTSSYGTYTDDNDNTYYYAEITFTADLVAGQKYQLSFVGTTNQQTIGSDYYKYQYKVFLNNKDLHHITGTPGTYESEYYIQNYVYTLFFTSETTGTANISFRVMNTSDVLTILPSNLAIDFRILLNKDFSTVTVNGTNETDYILGQMTTASHPSSDTFTDETAFEDDKLIPNAQFLWYTKNASITNDDKRTVVLPDLRYTPDFYLYRGYSDNSHAKMASELRTSELTLADSLDNGIEVKLTAQRLVNLLKLTQNQGLIPIIDNTDPTTTYVETNVTYNVNLDVNGDIDTYDVGLTYQNVLDAMAAHKDVFLKINVPGSGHYFAESNENYEDAANPTIRFYSVNYLFNVPVLQLFVLDSSDNLTKYSWLLKNVINFTAPDDYSMLTEKAVVDNFVRKPIKIFDKDDGLLVAGTLNTTYYTAGTGISKTNQINYAGTPCISGLNLTGIKYLKVICVRNDGYGTGNYTGIATFEIPLEYGVPNTASGAPGGTWHIGTAQAPVVRDSNRYMNVFGSVAYPADGSLANCNFEFNGAWTMYGTAATGVSNCYVVGIYAYYD